MANNIRVRFSPSPTGYLHVGSARTALYNWLWARKNNACFLLRIEDTDQKRSTPESKAIILESLQWLGIDWDEGPGKPGKYGPYEQMQRLDIYKYYADKLIAEGKAYRCYCTEDDLKANRNSLAEQRKAGDKGAFFKYPGTCRDRKDNPDKPFVVRFKAPTGGVVEYTDRIFGKMVVPNKENQDWVLLRSDGVPLYNFGAVVDDMTMAITLVARGRDHQVNTPPQILLYQALGAQCPEFSHMPMVLSPSGEKLSKRHGAVSVTEYRDNGYSPVAVLNYLVRFGWGFGNQEIFSLNQLIDAFSWEGCGKNDGRFDVKKFAAIQYEHMKSEALTPNDEYAHRTLPFLYARGIGDLNHKQVEKLVPMIRHKCKTFIEAANELDPILRSGITIDPAAKEKFINDTTKPMLKSYVECLECIDSKVWDDEMVRAAMLVYTMRHNTTLKDISQPIRVCITGRTNSPDLYQVMVALGKEATIDRIVSAIR